jgi:hypothetical protein
MKLSNLKADIIASLVCFAIGAALAVVYLIGLGEL